MGISIDYKRLLGFFRAQAHLVRASYYTALVEDQEFVSIRPLIDWLDYNGYTMVTKPVKEFTDVTGRRTIKSNIDIELTVGAMDPHPSSITSFFSRVMATTVLLLRLSNKRGCVSVSCRH